VKARAALLGLHGACSGTQRCIDEERYQCHCDADCVAAPCARCHPLCSECDGARDCAQSPLGQYCAADRSGCPITRIVRPLVGRCDGRACVRGFRDPSLVNACRRS
jgi:hypothetical protein